MLPALFRRLFFLRGRLARGRARLRFDFDLEALAAAIAGLRLRATFRGARSISGKVRRIVAEPATRPRGNA